MSQHLRLLALNDNHLFSVIILAADAHRHRQVGTYDLSVRCVSFRAAVRQHTRPPNLPVLESRSEEDNTRNREQGCFHNWS